MAGISLKERVRIDWFPDTSGGNRGLKSNPFPLFTL